MKLGTAPQRKIIAYETKTSFIFPIRAGSCLNSSQYNAVEIFKNGDAAMGASWRKPSHCIRTIYEGDEF